MAKWLILIAYDDLGYWARLRTVLNANKHCSCTIHDGALEACVVETPKDYSVALVTVTHELAAENFQSLLTTLLMQESDEVVTFCHQVHARNDRGMKTATVLSMRSSRRHFRLFHMAYPNRADNYPYWMIKELATSGDKFTWPSWEHLVEEGRKGSVLPVFFRLKHDLIHLLAPIDIDLQGLIEEDYDEKYWQSLQAEYQKLPARKALEAVRGILYGDQTRRTTGREILSIWEIVEAAKDNVSDVARAWEEVRVLLGETDPVEWLVVDELKPTGKLEALRSELIRGNPFSTWFRHFDAALDRLGEALWRAETANSEPKRERP